ncbi:hypothetical protein DB35_18995 [Streptomyces abyssalis]|uniref:SWIM-type domain-containing protein n=1 Tax=Streptomyces abyssalis TaxID=933944 RepID=A0A1E7JM61_9ACTN|nr:hypothetical protein AN215_20140 [Streptomyces abyssalis]OEU89443.1 hypothetical protein DB35_18995 [Streptomyces abyssalis]
MRADGSPAGGAAAGSGPASARARSLPPAPPRPGARGPFAESWWGNAWVRALEDSSLDAGRLSRGRTYARGGHVGTITVTPGRISAPVSGSRPRPYRTVIRMRVLTEREREAFLDAVCAQPAHIAALLDKDMPHALVDAAAAAGVRLLPGPGEPDPACSCPDSGRPCKHAAALCYQTARFLDADPFVLLLLRGQDEEGLIDELARRNAKLSAQGAGTDTHAGTGSGTGTGTGTGEGIPYSPPGIPARDALATSVRPPLPPPLEPPAAPGEPPLLPELPGAPDPAALTFLATGAARRAHAALTTGPAALERLPPPHDAVRLAATHPQLTGRGTFSDLFARLARGSGHTAQGLARAAAAWRQGDEGLSVLETVWDPPAGGFDRARGALAAAGLPRMTIRHNRLTDATGTLQLRYGRDGRWYPYRSERTGDGQRQEWWPEGPADSDPVAALNALTEG